MTFRFVMGVSIPMGIFKTLLIQHLPELLPFRINLLSFIQRNQRVEPLKRPVVHQGGKPLSAPAHAFIEAQAFRDQGDHLVFGKQAGQFPGQAWVTAQPATQKNPIALGPRFKCF